MIYFAIYFFIFFVGACVGSFLNVLIWRIPRGMNFTTDRSICPKCGKQIKEYDLIPVLSYIILGGKCRNCHDPISLRYPAMEGVTGLIFVLIIQRLGFTLSALLALISASVLIVIAMIDYDTMEIPDGLVIALGAVAIASAFISPQVSVASRIIGALCVSVPMLLLALLIENAFGGGDIKLMLAAGFMLGWKLTLLATFIGLLTGSIVGVAMLASKKAERGQSIPFGPHLCLGILIAMLYGNAIVAAYVRTFF